MLNKVCMLFQTLLSWCESFCRIELNTMDDKMFNHNKFELARTKSEAIERLSNEIKKLKDEVINTICYDIGVMFYYGLKKYKFNSSFFFYPADLDTRNVTCIYHVYRNKDNKEITSEVSFDMEYVGRRNIFRDAIVNIDRIDRGKIDGYCYDECGIKELFKEFNISPEFNETVYCKKHTTLEFLCVEILGYRQVLKAYRKNNGSINYLVKNAHRMV